jgi:excinuclease UvrABC helicase subunit UvrB
LQLAYNEKHGIKPKTVMKKIESMLGLEEEREENEYFKQNKHKPQKYDNRKDPPARRRGRNGKK